MSYNKSAQESKHQKNQESAVIIKIPDVVENMNIPTDGMIEDVKDAIQTLIDKKPNISDVLDEEHNDNKKTLESIERNDEKDVTSPNDKNKDIFITMPVYETYYGLQQRQDETPPQYQYLPPRQSRHLQTPTRYAGGGEVLVYDPSTRNYFVKFVFLIVLIMLLITAGFIAFVLATDDVKRVFRRHSLVFIITGLILLLVCDYAMYLSQCTRAPPCNYLVLLLSMVAMCILGANISARYRTELVLFAVLATAIVVLVCFLLACSKFDFTSWLLYVIVIATVVSVIAMIFFITSVAMGYKFKPLHIAIVVIGTLLQTVMLVIQLQMILGGKTVELSEDDYALGAFMLYTSVMTLFMQLLQIAGFVDG